MHPPAFFANLTDPPVHVVTIDLLLGLLFLYWMARSHIGSGLESFFLGARGLHICSSTTYMVHSCVYPSLRCVCHLQRTILFFNSSGVDYSAFGPRFTLYNVLDLGLLVVEIGGAWFLSLPPPLVSQTE